MGGGRGDLAVHIAKTFPDVIVTVVDANERSLRQGELFARSQGQPISARIRFICANVTEEFSPQAVANLGGSGGNYNENSSDLIDFCATNVDFVVALHACGGLSDLAMRFAVLNSCRFVVCPCCYLKNPFLLPLAPMERGNLEAAVDENHQSPVFVTSSAHAITDSTSVDVATSITGVAHYFKLNFVSHTDRGVLLRLAESDNRSVSLRACRVINSQRLNSLQSMLHDSKATLEMEQFPPEYSLRNTLLMLS